jgi:hypothetical protein
MASSEGMIAGNLPWALTYTCRHHTSHSLCGVASSALSSCLSFHVSRAATKPVLLIRVFGGKMFVDLLREIDKVSAQVIGTPSESAYAIDEIEMLLLELVNLAADSIAELGVPMDQHSESASFSVTPVGSSLSEPATNLAQDAPPVACVSITETPKFMLALATLAQSVPNMDVREKFVETLQKLHSLGYSLPSAEYDSPSWFIPNQKASFFFLRPLVTLTILWTKICGTCFDDESQFDLAPVHLSGLQANSAFSRNRANTTCHHAA